MNKMDNGPIVRAAVRWYRTEFPLKTMVTLGDMLAVAVPRVMAVFRGEVTWSQASPGDKAIWIGRPRNIASFQQNSERWENVWDTVQIGPGPNLHGRHCNTDAGSMRLFGNENIGNYWLCNLRVADLMSRDCWVGVEQMYADVDRSPEPTESILITFDIGFRHVSRAHLQDVIAGHPIGQVIRTREHFSVRVDWTNVKEPLKLTVHLEGVSRDAIY